MRFNGGNMKPYDLTYEIQTIPDPFFSPYQNEAGGDVQHAISRNVEQLLRITANLPPESAILTIRYSFSPIKNTLNKQSRLKIHFNAQSHDMNILDTIRLIIENGPLSRYYQFNEVRDIIFDTEELNAGCLVIRKEDQVTPLHKKDLNYRIPDYYYLLHGFQPNRNNNYHMLDRVLDRIEEPVRIDISIQPVNITDIIFKHTQYLASLQSVNRSWDRDEEEYDYPDYFLEEPERRRNKKKQGIDPLQRKDPLADDVLKKQQKIHESLRSPHLGFHILVQAQTRHVSWLVAAMTAESAFENGEYRIYDFDGSDDVFHKVTAHYDRSQIIQAPVHRRLFNGNPDLYRHFSVLSQCAPIEELTGAFRFPVSGPLSPYCIPRNTDPEIYDENEMICFGADYHINQLARGPHLHHLDKHGFITGTTGTGKTTSGLNLFMELFRHGIPVLLIESLKTDYRKLKTLKKSGNGCHKRLGKTLNIFTPGQENISPMRFNPLAIPPGISAEEHMDNVRKCFESSIPVSGPLHSLIKEGLEALYRRFPNCDTPPNMMDFFHIIKEVMGKKEYSQNTKSDIFEALNTRMNEFTGGAIGKIFDCDFNVPGVESLLMNPTIIELDRLHEETACAFVFFLFMEIQYYLRTETWNHKKPKCVIIIEEAHKLLGKSSDTVMSPDNADPKSHASKMFTNLLAEIREAGIGIVFIDQLPTAIPSEVIKNTKWKMVFNEVHEEDRQEIGSAMLMNTAEKEELARLKIGEAFFITEGFHRPIKIRSHDISSFFDERIPYKTEDLIPLLSDEDWYLESLFQVAAQELTILKKKMDLFDHGISLVMRDFVNISSRFYRKHKNAPSAFDVSDLKYAQKDVYKLKQTLLTRYDDFKNKHYKSRIHSGNRFKYLDQAVKDMKANLMRRYENIITKGVNTAVRMMDEFMTIQ